MKKLLLFISFFSLFATNAQTNFRIYTELSQGASFYFQNAIFLDSDVSLGGQWNTSKGVFTVCAKYRYGSYVFTEVTPFTYRYSAIGIGLNYRLFGEGKKVSPFARLAVATELKPGRTTSENDLTNYFLTPFFGEFSLGIEAMLIKNLSINFTLGAGVRAMKSTESPSIEQRTLMKGITAQLGVSYGFSVKKNIAMETEK